MKRTMLALAAITLLSACGVRGGLERPDPLWNSEEAIRRECARQRENNERVDARCTQYESGAQSSSIAPSHEVTVDMGATTETVQRSADTSVPDVIRTDTPPGQ